MWRHNDVIGRNEYLISTLSESTVPWVYSLQFLFKSTHHSWRYERKCEWVFFFWTQCIYITVICGHLNLKLCWSAVFRQTVLHCLSPGRLWYAPAGVERSTQSHSRTKSINPITWRHQQLVQCVVKIKDQEFLFWAAVYTIALCAVDSETDGQTLDVADWQLSWFECVAPVNRFPDTYFD